MHKHRHKQTPLSRSAIRCLEFATGEFYGYKWDSPRTNKLRGGSTIGR